MAPHSSMFDSLRSLRLRGRDRKKMSQALARYMLEHPVLLSEAAAHNRPEPWAVRIADLLKMLALRPVAACAIFLLLASIGSATIAGAEQSLPGDFLYPMKVNVMEEAIEAALYFAQETGATWTIHRVERRLEESMHLAEERDANPEQMRRLSEKMEQHVDAALSVMMELVEEGEYFEAMEIGQNLHTSLDAYSHALHAMAERHQQAYFTKPLLVVEVELADALQETQEVQEFLSDHALQQENILEEVILKHQLDDAHKAVTTSIAALKDEKREQVFGTETREAVINDLQELLEHADEAALSGAPQEALEYAFQAESAALEIEKLLDIAEEFPGLLTDEFMQ